MFWRAKALDLRRFFFFDHILLATVSSWNSSAGPPMFSAPKKLLKHLLKLKVYFKNDSKSIQFMWTYAISHICHILFISSISSFPLCSTMALTLKKNSAAAAHLLLSTPAATARRHQADAGILFGFSNGDIWHGNQKQETTKKNHHV